jgi:hypothetical protein
MVPDSVNPKSFVMASSANTLRDLGEAKIEKLDAGGRHENVGGLQVPVDDALSVGGIERVADLQAVGERLLGQ